MKLLEHCYVISNNSIKLDQMYKWFDQANLPRPILFEATGNCEKSHYDLVKYAKEQNLPYITIFEDDAQPALNAIELLEECEKQIDKIWDDVALVQLGSNGVFGWHNSVTNIGNDFNDYFYLNTKTCPGTYAIFLKASAFDDRLKSLKTPSNVLGYNYMEINNIEYNYADRFSAEQFQQKPLIVKKNIFAHFDVLKNKRRGYQDNFKKLPEQLDDNCRHLTIQQMLENSFVISINDDQLDFFYKVFEKSGLNPMPKFFEGIKTKQIKDYTCEVPKKCHSVINCMMSHLFLVRLAKYLDLPFICIFEDDAYPCKDILVELERQLKNIPNKIKLLTLGNIRFKAHKEKLYTSTGNYIKVKYNHGSHAYIVFKEGYDDYINVVNTENAIADLVFEKMPQIYSTNENLFIQANICSSMHQTSGRHCDNEHCIKQTHNISHYIDNSIDVPLCGRYGNAFFEIAHAISENKQFDITKPITCIIKHINNRPLELDVYEKNNLLPDFFNGQLKFIYDKSMSNDAFTGFQQSEKYFDKDKIKKVFQLNQTIINQLKEKYKEVDFENTVGIHIRRTDYLNNKNSVFHKPKTEYYTDMYNLHFNGKQAMICSDDIEWCKNNLKIENSIYHSENVVSDFILLALCKHHICSNSTFSWWACWMLERNDSINIFPNKYFNWIDRKIRKDIEENLIPDRWIKNPTQY